MQPPEADEAATPEPAPPLLPPPPPPPSTRPRQAPRSSFTTAGRCYFHETAARPPRYLSWPAFAPAVRGDGGGGARNCTRIRRRRSTPCWAAVAVLSAGGVGQSLGYNLPALHALATDASARCLYLFPTRPRAGPAARIADAELRRCPPLWRARRHLRRRHAASGAPDVRAYARVIITNPDMLHCALLPGHSEWARARDSRLIVVDEAHMYRGVFGSHVASILRRLRRLAAMHGAAVGGLLLGDGGQPAGPLRGADGDCGPARPHRMDRHGRRRRL